MRRELDAKGVGQAERKPATYVSEEMELWPLLVLGKKGGGDMAQIEGREGTHGLNTGSPDPVVDGQGDSKASSPPLSVQVHPSPSLSLPVPSYSCPSAQAPSVSFSFDQNCTQSPEPEGAQDDYEHLTYDELHELRRTHGYARRARNQC